MSEIVIENVHKIYHPEHGRDVFAVQGVSLAIEAGELLVLLGPSGCGKSTLLRMIAGLEEVTEGAISIGGRVVNDVLPKDRDVAMVFQNYALFPHMTVRENMAFGLKFRGEGREEIERRVGEASRLLQLEEVLDRRPGALSGGQRQRTALGRALVRRPRVFLLDEPLSNLDARLRTDMRAEIARLHAKLGVTMIYVTHDQAEAMTLGQRLCVMHYGKIVQVGPPMEVYRNPQTMFVAGFVGNPGMNLIAGSMTDGGEGTVFTPCEGGRVYLGIRPEDIVLDPSGAAGPDLWRATVEVSEPLGHETLVHLRLGSQKLIARTPGVYLRPFGEAVKVCYARQQARFFDAATRKALT